MEGEWLGAGGGRGFLCRQRPNEEIEPQTLLRRDDVRDAHETPVDDKARPRIRGSVSNLFDCEVRLFPVGHLLVLIDAHVEEERHECGELFGPTAAVDGQVLNVHDAFDGETRELVLEALGVNGSGAADLMDVR